MSTGSLDPKRKRVGNPRQRATVSCLPMPQTRDYINKWRRLFTPSLVKWAGSLDDPFGANGKMNDAFDTLWKDIYHDIPLDDEKMRDVVTVVGLLFLYSNC